jgi:hypothetical protein
MPTLVLKTTVADERDLALNHTLSPDFPMKIIKIVVRTEKLPVASHKFAATRHAALSKAWAKARLHDVYLTAVQV